MNWWTIDKSSSIKYVCLKKEVAIISISFRGNRDLFFCPIRKTTLTFCSGCRSPPEFDLKNFKSNGGNKMDKRPKRSRDKYNPYILHSDKSKNIYKVTFSNLNKIAKVKISKKIFEQLDEFEKEDARQIQEIKRHYEQNEVTEITLNKRAFDKPEDVDEIVIKNIYSEKLEQAMKTLTKEQRRRILLYYDYQLTMEEIAKVESCSKQSVQESIEWGIKKLKKFFEKF